jgi:hypothetical protein
MISAEELTAVDGFLAQTKRLYKIPPEFGPSKFQRGEPASDAIWPIEDSLGVITSGQLRIVSRAGAELGATIAVIYANQCVCRLDFVPLSVCHPNPAWAQYLGLPPIVCGPHYHGWEHNREHVAESGVWKLPVRETLQPQIKKFEQALPWLASKINLVLTDEQRAFEFPRRLL